MKRRAFTIIELLVVIAILALLISILVPALSNAKKQVKRVVCSTNIRNLLLAMSSYESDNDRLMPGLDFDTGSFPSPPPGGFVGNAMKDTLGWWWFHYIWEDVGANPEGLLRCPDRKYDTAEVVENVLCSNYAVNQGICKATISNKGSEFTGQSLRTGDIRSTANTLLLVDAGYSIVTRLHADSNTGLITYTGRDQSTYIPGLSVNSTRPIWVDQEDDAINGRHPKKTVNVGFVDGHVSALKAEKLLVKPGVNKSIWNP